MNVYKYTYIQSDIFERIREHANNACIGGVSRVRTQDRQPRLAEDQLVGQLGEFALSRFLGNEEAYFERRSLRDLNPRIGDSGSDFSDLPIDVKTSRMRRSQDPGKYNLLVRPDERHSDWLYVAAFAERNLEPPVKVVLAGWISESLLPDETAADPRFEGAYALPVPLLNSMAYLLVPSTP